MANLLALGLLKSHDETVKSLLRLCLSVVTVILMAFTILCSMPFIYQLTFSPLRLTCPNAPYPPHLSVGTSPTNLVVGKLSSPEVFTSSTASLPRSSKTISTTDSEISFATVAQSPCHVAKCSNPLDYEYSAITDYGRLFVGEMSRATFSKSIGSLEHQDFL